MKTTGSIWSPSEPSNSCGSSVLILISFLLFVSPSLAQAQFTYTTNTGGTSITITGGPTGALNIPGSINGLFVTSIGAGAFVGPYFSPDVLLTSVTIPDTVTNIGDYAFYNCPNLTEVILSNGLIAIGVDAFSEDDALSSIRIPGSVSNIGDGAFENCTSLTNVSLSETLTNIGSGAFESCSNLTSIIIPCSVVAIGTNAFEYCTGLTNATISYGLANIGPYAFYGCRGLTNIIIPGSVSNVGEGAFGLSSLINLTISNGVSVIGDVAFGWSAVLTSVSFPPSVRSIGLQAFCLCKSLTNVTFSYGLTNIGLSAFAGCPITSLCLPASLLSCGEGAFAGCSFGSLSINGGFSGDYTFDNCTNLTNVTIGAGVTNLAFSMFAYCNSLTNVFFQGNAPAASGDPEDGTLVFYSPQICYYLPGTTGWSNTYQEVPAVLWNPLIQTGNGNFGVQNNQFGFDITGTPAIPIVVEASTNLANPVWTALTNVTLTNGLFHFSEPLQAGSPARYYRIGSP